MSIILITGGSGFIGSHFTERLLSKGHQVHVMDNRAGDPHLVEYHKATYHRVDVRDTSVIDIVEQIKPDIIYHLASSYSSKESVEDIKSTAEVNIVGTINMLEAARKVHVQKFIFTSTSAVYGSPAYVGIDENHPLTPLKPYGMTKRSAEEFIQLYARLHNMPYTILRLSTVYGKRQPSTCDGDMIAGLIDRYMHHKPIVINGDGQQSRDFVFIDDVLDVLELCISRGNNSIFNIGSGHGTLINELVNLLNATFEIHVEPEYKAQAECGPKDLYFDISLALSNLDWSPKFDIEDGILETVHYYKRSLRL